MRNKIYSALIKSWISFKIIYFKGFSIDSISDRRVYKEGRLSYADFVWFLISEEDKKTDTRYASCRASWSHSCNHFSSSNASPLTAPLLSSIEYWFRCMDLDGDGVLSMYELEYFYDEQCQKLEAMAIEPLPFEDCLCQMLDLVKPEVEGQTLTFRHTLI